MAEHRPYLDLVATSLPGRAFAPQTLARSESGPYLGACARAGALSEAKIKGGTRPPGGFLPRDPFEPAKPLKQAP